MTKAELISELRQAVTAYVTGHEDGDTLAEDVEQICNAAASLPTEGGR